MSITWNGSIIKEKSSQFFRLGHSGKDVCDMTDVLNVGAVHNGGSPDLTVGIRSNQFKIGKNEGQVELVDPNNDNAPLRLKAADFVTSDGSLSNKQSKLSGNQGQIVGFDENGNAVAQDAPDADVVGPNASTDSGLAAFSGTGGKTLKKAGTKGSATQGIYLDSNGVPQPMTYSVGKSVPSDAVFTDTTYTDATSTKSGLMSATDKQNFDDMMTNGATKTYVNTTVSNAIGVAIGGSY